MKNWLFYPLSALVIVLMISYALSFSTVSEPVDPNIYELSSDSLTELFPSPGTTVQLANDTNGAVAYAVLTGQLNRENAPPSAGVFGTLGPVHEKNFAGAPIRITIRARQGQFDPSEAFEAAYFTSGAGDSGWQRFQLSPDFADYSFVFTPGVNDEKASTDFIGIWPDPSGRKLTLDLLSIRVEKIVDALPHSPQSGN